MSIFKSRKFWLAVFGLAQALVLNYFEVPEAIWQMFASLIGVVIAGIALEDAGQKSAGS